MPLSPLPEDTISLKARQVHTMTTEVLLSTFDEVCVDGYSYTQNTLWEILLFASVNRISIKSACQTLCDAPSHSWVYTTLKDELLKGHTTDSLETRINNALQTAFPKRLIQRKQKVAIDLVLIPYYGDSATDGIRRSCAKKSTTKFFCYATAYLIKKHKRVTLQITCVHKSDTLFCILARLLCRIEALGIRMKRLYLDREFASVDVLSYLTKQPFVSVVALPKKGEQLKAMQQGKKSKKTQYTMTSSSGQSIRFPLWVAVRYWKGKHRKHGARYLFFAVIGACRSSILSIAEEYRHRFGIEASYRIMNQVRAMTTSKNPLQRFLLVGIAFLLTNLWVWLKWNIWLIARRRQNSDIPFTLNMFCHLQRESIKQAYGMIMVIQL